MRLPNTVEIGGIPVTAIQPPKSRNDVRKR